MPNIGYGSDRKTKHMIPSGFYKFTVGNESEVDMLMMHSQKFAVEIAHAVSARNRKVIVARAEQLGLKVLNKFSRQQKIEVE